MGGKRCISDFATRLLPAPPCLHRPIRIWVALSSRLSNGSLEIKLMRMRRLSSITSGCFSDDSNVRNNDSKCGCTSDRFSVDLSISSIVHIAFDRKRQSYRMIKWKHNYKVYEFSFYCHRQFILYSLFYRHVESVNKEEWVNMCCVESFS